MKQNAVETVMGAVVLVIAAVFLFFAYTTTKIQTTGGYELTARFDRVSGLRNGSEVRISGIPVGTVVSQTLDPKTYLAIVKISVDPTVKLSTDTVATIATTGLLGDNYLSLEPGNLDETIPPGGTIVNTEPPMDLQSIIGKVIYSMGGEKKSTDNGTGPSSGDPPK